MKTYVYPKIGHDPLKDITRADCLNVLRAMEVLGLGETCRRVLGYMRHVFAFAGLEHDPTSTLSRVLVPIPKSKHFAALTTPEEVAGLMRAIEGYRGSFITQCALKLAPMLFVRPGELQQAEWHEFNLDRAEWRIPAEKMKMRQPHLVPLAKQAVAILRELHRVTGRGR